MSQSPPKASEGNRNCGNSGWVWLFSNFKPLGTKKNTLVSASSSSLLKQFHYDISKWYNHIGVTSQPIVRYHHGFTKLIIHSCFSPKCISKWKFVLRVSSSNTGKLQQSVGWLLRRCRHGTRQFLNASNKNIIIWRSFHPYQILYVRKSNLKMHGSRKRISKTTICRIFFWGDSIHQ